MTWSPLDTGTTLFEGLVFQMYGEKRTSGEKWAQKSGLIWHRFLRSSHSL